MSVFVVSGPTGSGKTDFAFQISQAIQCPLINADAFQFYSELPIIGNQPTALASKIEWMGFRSIRSPLTAGDFSRLTLSRIEHSGLWVGTGLYLGAALYGLDDDRRKGVPFQGEPRRPYRMIVLDPDRSQLYENLNLRVDQMIERGAMEEAKQILRMLLEGELQEANPILKAIGLQHLLKHLRGEMNFERTIEVWKRDTRRLAKRQWTWLRKFAPPSSSCLWLSENSPRQAIEFFDKA